MENYILNKTNLRFVYLSVRKLKVHILFGLSIPPLPLLSLSLMHHDAVVEPLQHTLHQLFNVTISGNL